MSKTPWILATQEPMGFWCRRCDLRLKLEPPVGVNDYVVAGNGFVATHAACEPPPAAVEVARAGGTPLPRLED